MKPIGIKLFAALLWLCIAVHSRMDAQAIFVGTGTLPGTPSAQLDTNLLAAAAPSATPTQVQQSLDGLFALAGFPPSVADAFSITSQIAGSQLSYNSGHYVNLSEANVVTAVNNLVSAWGLPSNALTSAAEVRQLHVALILGCPRYMLGGANGQPGTNMLVRTAMSPLETTFLFAMLLHQKISNPQYQMTPAQFTAYNAAIAAGQTPAAPQDQSAAINAAVQTAVSNIGAFGVLLQLNQTMTDLGVIGGAQ